MESEEVLYLNDIFKGLARFKWLIMFIVFCFTLGAYVYNWHLSKPMYRSTVTFFLPPDPNQGQGASSPYAKLLGQGGGANASLDNYMSAFVNSNRLRVLVAKQVAYLYPQAKNLDEVISDLKFKHLKFIGNDTGVFEIEFQHENPRITFEVVKATLRSFDMINQELDLSPQRQLYIILDAPELPKAPFNTAKIRNLFFAFVGGLLFGIAIALVLDFFKPVSQKNELA